MFVVSFVFSAKPLVLSNLDGLETVLEHRLRTLEFGNDDEKQKVAFMRLGGNSAEDHW